jgi:hypothetical protein
MPVLLLLVSMITKRGDYYTLMFDTTDENIFIEVIVLDKLLTDIIFILIPGSLYSTRIALVLTYLIYTSVFHSE